MNDRHFVSFVVSIEGNKETNDRKVWT